MSSADTTAELSPAARAHAERLVAEAPTPSPELAARLAFLLLHRRREVAA